MLNLTIYLILLRLCQRRECYQTMNKIIIKVFIKLLTLRGKEVHKSICNINDSISNDHDARQSKPKITDAVSKLCWNKHVSIHELLRYVVIRDIFLIMKLVH